MQVEKLRSLIRESINEYISEINKAGDKAACEAKINATQAAIEKRKKMANMEGIDEAYHDMLDKGKMKEIGGEIKALERNLTKLRKQLDKLDSKSESKKEVTTDVVTEEAPIDEADVTAQIEMSDDEMKEEALNESFLKMQKIAGVITEGQYREKVQMLNEGYKFNDANEDTAKEIKNKIKPAIENTLKKAMIDISTKNPELKGAPNYGLAVGLIAYDIVMDLA